MSGLYLENRDRQEGGGGGKVWFFVNQGGQ